MENQTKKAWNKPVVTDLNLEMTENQWFQCGKDAYYEGIAANHGPITQIIVGTLTGGS